MSSLGATQADGYYIPPQYLDSGAYKKKSVSEFNSGSTKGHNQFLQRSVVRFELPYDGFCKNKSCNVHVGRGTRFNAHKSHVDDYHSTKIWEFTMKCRACAVQKFIIRTDPKGRCFDYTMGIHKKVEEFDTVDAGTLGVIDTDVGNGIVPSSSLCHDSSSCHRRTAVDNSNNDKNNPLEKLETRMTGERKAMTERDAMELLLTHNKSTMFDDASSNSALRSTYRNVRNAKRRRLRNAQDVGLGKGIELHDKDTLKMSPEDSLAFFRAEDGKKDNLSRERTLLLFVQRLFFRMGVGGGKVYVKLYHQPLQPIDLRKIELNVQNLNIGLEIMI